MLLISSETYIQFSVVLFGAVYRHQIYYTVFQLSVELKIPTK